MVTNTREKATPAGVISELEKLAVERIDALRKAGIEPYVEVERTAEEQRRARRAIYEWRKQRLEARETS